MTDIGEIPDIPFHMGLSTQPGSKELTRTGRFCISRHRALVKAGRELALVLDEDP